MGRTHPELKAVRLISLHAPDPTLAAYCPDLAQWPQRWRYEDRDLEPGQAIVEVLAPFLLHLLSTGLARKTLRIHRDNLWLLGGDVIRRIQDEPALRKRPTATLLDLLDDDGGPLLYPPVSEEEQRAFDATCRKLRAFLIPAGARNR